MLATENLPELSDQMMLDCYVETLHPNITFFHYWKFNNCVTLIN